MSEDRIDKLLFQWGMAYSRTLAQALIEEGLVKVNGRLISKPSEKWPDNLETRSSISIEPGQSNRYVSRGGLKLERALEHLQLKPKDFVCIDIGLSTGGFSDCLFKNGAQKVLGIDVGTKQVHESLQKNPNLIVLENTNIKEFSKETLVQFDISKVDLIVADLSFISLTKVLPKIKTLAQSQTHYLLLVKPQFELTSKDLNKKGIVKNKKSYSQVKKNIVDSLTDLDLNLLDYFESSLLGGDGNKEFFLYANQKPSTPDFLSASSLSDSP